MEYLIKNPVLGAFLNLVAFGLADLYVGHFATAIFKLLLCLAGNIIFVKLMQRLPPDYSVGQLIIMFQCVYIPFALITGYVTVLKSRKETHPTN